MASALEQFTLAYVLKPNIKIFVLHLVNVSKELQIIIFKRFQKAWTLKNTANYKTTSSDDQTINAVAIMK